MLTRLLLAVVAVLAVVVCSAPTNEDRSLSASLKAEHRKPNTQTPHPIEDIMEAVLNSETVSAVDEAAARVTYAFGDIIDDLGDFMVNRVKDLPATIAEVSDTVSKAVSEGGEQVVILVKGVRTRMQNQTATAVPSVINAVDRMNNAANSSKTAASFNDLHQRMAVSLGRILGSLFYNMDEIDSAVADGIRRITAGTRLSTTRNRSSVDAAQPHSQQNEVEVLS